MTDEEAEPEGATAKLRNATSTSLSFRVPGQSAYLAPGETRELPLAYLETDELKALIRQGSIVIDDTTG